VLPVRSEVREDIDSGLQGLGRLIIRVEIEDAPVRGIGVNTGDVRRREGPKRRQRHDLGAAGEIGHEPGSAVARDDLTARVQGRIWCIRIHVERRISRDLLGLQDRLQVFTAVVFLFGGDADHLLRTVLQNGQEVLHRLAADEADHH